MHNNLVNLGRAAGMLWLSIGEPRTIEVQSVNGTVKKEVTDYAIHFQCQWRFVKEGKILLASHDIYNPYDKNLEWDDDWDWDVFGREKDQSSIFDVHSKRLINELLPLKIENIYYTDTYDLHIDFDKKICFDTFITISTKREFYRFLDHATREHTVIFDATESQSAAGYIQRQQK